VEAVSGALRKEVAAMADLQVKAAPHNASDKDRKVSVSIQLSHLILHSQLYLSSVADISDAAGSEIQRGVRALSVHSRPGFSDLYLPAGGP